jgi:hypothetical protein
VWTVPIVAVTIPLTVRRFRARTDHWAR